jgi:hypothetical protein
MQPRAQRHFEMAPHEAHGRRTAKFGMRAQPHFLRLPKLPGQNALQAWAFGCHIHKVGPNTQPGLDRGVAGQDGIGAQPKSDWPVRCSALHQRTQRH